MKYKFKRRIGMCIFTFVFAYFVFNINAFAEDVEFKWLNDYSDTLDVESADEIEDQLFEINLDEDIGECAITIINVEDDINLEELVKENISDSIKACLVLNIAKNDAYFMLNDFVEDEISDEDRFVLYNRIIDCLQQGDVKQGCQIFIDTVSPAFEKQAKLVIRERKIKEDSLRVLIVKIVVLSFIILDIFISCFIIVKQKFLKK